MMWRVRNTIGAEGLPADAWAQSAAGALRRDLDVQSAEVVAVFYEDEVEMDGRLIAGLDVNVVIDAADGDAAASTVQRIVTAALLDVVGDEEVGWSPPDWKAEPLA